jgi:TIR domain
MVEGPRQLFISYARSDAERVNALVEGLRQLRHDIWLDVELTGGQAWWDTILSQIRASSAVLVAVSTAALESVAVRREYGYGHAVGRPLLPVVVDRVRLEMLPFLLARLQAVDYCQPGARNAFDLAAAIAALPAPQTLPRPLPDPPPIPVSYLSGLKERSQAAALSMDEQLALVAHLKIALGRAGERESAEEVLRSLQKRSDLYQVSAREIESLLLPLNRPATTPEPQTASHVPSLRPWTRIWVAKDLSRDGKSVRVELLGNDRHVLEISDTWWSVRVYLDGNKLAGLNGYGFKKIRFNDGGEMVTGSVGWLLVRTPGTPSVLP